MALVALSAAAGVAAGCGGGDSSGGGNSSSGGSAPAKKKPAAGGAAKVDQGKLSMQMGEMFFRPKQVATPAGKLRITERNVGRVTHEFILVRSSSAPGSLPAPGGRVDEEKLKVVGEIADVASGQSKSKTFNLKPGKYVFICNVPGHYVAGMSGGLTVK